MGIEPRRKIKKGEIINEDQNKKKSKGERTKLIEKQTI